MSRQFGHWNGDDDTEPFWKIEVNERDTSDWERCADADGKVLIAFKDDRELHRYLRRELGD